jgi:hypothetical protein
MSVSATGSSSLPDPGFYAYPSTSAAADASSSSSSSASGTASTPAGTSSAATAPVQSPYQSAYDDLVQQDTAELLQVSFGSQADAQSNLASVLAQAAALQRQQLAAQQQAQSAPPPPIAAPAVPTLTSLLQQSDGDASSDLAQGTLGASIDTSA